MSKDASLILPGDVSTLQSLLLAERKQSQHRVTTLKEELSQREEQLAQAQSQLTAKDLELKLQAEAHRQKQAQLERRIAELLKQFFAKRRERFVHPDQLMLFDLDELTGLAQEAQQQAQEEELLARRRGKPRTRICMRKGCGHIFLRPPDRRSPPGRETSARLVLAEVR